MGFKPLIILSSVGHYVIEGEQPVTIYNRQLGLSQYMCHK